jgi:hypothetical protein
MKCGRHLALALCSLIAPILCAQDAKYGVDLRATLTGQAIASGVLTDPPRSGSPVIAGSRSVAYPTFKFGDHWFATAAGQLVTRPFYYSDLSAPGYGAKGSLLQASLNYSRVSNKGSLLLRAGELSTAFGSFLLRYDDAENPLVDLPQGYGYYYTTVSILPVAGAQVDATRGRFDGRVQLANSSHANPRSVFAPDQYANWAGGGGFTIRQGFRIGISGYRGPYLDRHYAYYAPGELNPNRLPARAVGVDGNWAHRHTTVYFEAQRFLMPYTKSPDFRESVGYAEIRQVFGPRWFIAGRYGLSSTNFTGRIHSVEASLGYRPDRFQLLKIDYEYEHFSSTGQQARNILGIQFITTLHLSAGRD